MQHNAVRIGDGIPKMGVSTKNLFLQLNKISNYNKEMFYFCRRKSFTKTTVKVKTLPSDNPKKVSSFFSRSDV